MIDRKGEVSRLRSAIQRARAQLDNIEGLVDDRLNASEAAEALVTDAAHIVKQVAVIGLHDRWGGP